MLEQASPVSWENNNAHVGSLAGTTRRAPLTICFRPSRTILPKFSVKYSPCTRRSSFAREISTILARSLPSSSKPDAARLTRCLARLSLLNGLKGWLRRGLEEGERERERERERGSGWGESSLNNWTIIGRFAGVQTRFRKMAACLARPVNYSIVPKRNFIFHPSPPSSCNSLLVSRDNTLLLFIRYDEGEGIIGSSWLRTRRCVFMDNLERRCYPETQSPREIPYSRRLAMLSLLWRDIQTSKQL